MKSLDLTRMRWRKYASRFFLLIILLLFVSCKDEGCDSGPDICGESVKIQKGFTDPVVLTDKNPTIRVITDEACACGGVVEYSVYYQYHDIPTAPGSFTHTSDAAKHTEETSETPPMKQGTEKDKPLVTVKFGTLEKGLQGDAGGGKPGFTNGWWAVSGIGGPPKVKEGTTPAPIHYVLSITMQRPLIRLAGKAPTIVLPFVGPVIGPQPRDVDVQIILNYQQPLPAKAK